MRPFALICFCVLALASPANAQAFRAGFGTDGVQLANGRGFATLVSREGAILGSVGRGSVAIQDFVGGERTSIQVSGCERRRRPALHTRVCIGRHLRFVVQYGAWRVTMRGRKIDASAVVEGRLTLQGRAGTYWLKGGDPHRWPRSVERFELD